MRKTILMLFMSLLTFNAVAENSLEVRWQNDHSELNKLSYIEFLLDTDEAIYGMQIEGRVSKSWLKNINTGKSFYIPLKAGDFFNIVDPAVINSTANKQTGDFSYVASLIRPALAVKNDAVIFRLPVEPTAESLANLSLTTVKLARQDGSVLIIEDIEIESLTVGVKPMFNIQAEFVYFAVLLLVIIVSLLLLFIRKRNRIQPVTT